MSFSSTPQRRHKSQLDGCGHNHRFQEQLGTHESLLNHELLGDFMGLGEHPLFAMNLS